MKNKKLMPDYITTPEKGKKCLITPNTTFAVTEAYKAARTNLLFTRSGKGCQIIVVTSSFSGEGKTVNCINLGITMAQNGLRVLVIDADMRRPQIQQMFNIKSRYGLSEILAGLSAGYDMNNEGNVIYKTTYDHFYVLPAGHTPPNPAELLNSQQMELLLKTLESKFDYILIDSPPISVVTDAAVLSGLVNGYILVVRQNYTPMEALQATVMRMNHLELNIIGFLLTDAEAKSSYKKRGYGYGKYRRYGKYGYNRFNYGHSTDPYVTSTDDMSDTRK